VIPNTTQVGCSATPGSVAESCDAEAVTNGGEGSSGEAVILCEACPRMCEISADCDEGAGAAMDAITVGWRETWDGWLCPTCVRAFAFDAARTNNSQSCEPTQSGGLLKPTEPGEGK
jgi:hypothetical protein